jgi:hypothetical protein
MFNITVSRRDIQACNKTIYMHGCTMLILVLLNEDSW